MCSVSGPVMSDLKQAFLNKCACTGEFPHLGEMDTEIVEDGVRDVGR